MNWKDLRIAQLASEADVILYQTLRLQNTAPTTTWLLHKYLTTGANPSGGMSKCPRHVLCASLDSPLSLLHPALCPGMLSRIEHTQRLTTLWPWAGVWPISTGGDQQARRKCSLAAAPCTKGHTGKTLYTTVSSEPSNIPAPWPWGPELVSSPILVAQMSHTIPCGFPTLTHSSQITPSECATCFLQALWLIQWQKRTDAGVPMNTGGRLGEPSLSLMAGSRKERWRTAIIT